ncbi:MAG: hypothetical protein RRA35_04825 [Desulfomonilia bacterium]|nr:hypothetical protein [Desulfomonilia bacterium]
MKKIRASAGASPLHEYDLISCVMRFIGTAVFGLFIDCVVLCVFVIMFLMGYALSFSSMLTILLAIPLTWGILGIFFFHETLDMTNEIFSNFFSLLR